MQSTSEYTWVLAPVFNLLAGLPLLVVQIGGLAIAIAQWNRHPRVSLYTIVSISIAVVWTIAMSFVYTLLPNYLLQTRGFTPTQYGNVVWILGFVSSLVHAVAFALLLTAIFSGRNTRG